MSAEYQRFAADFAASPEAAPYLDALRTFRVLRGPGKQVGGHACDIYPEAEIVTQFALCMAYVKMFNDEHDKRRGCVILERATADQAPNRPRRPRVQQRQHRQQEPVECQRGRCAAHTDAERGSPASRPPSRSATGACRAPPAPARSARAPLRCAP